jgi:hypothetical protein
MNIRYDGHCYQVQDTLTDVTRGRSDEQIKARLAFFLDVWPRLLDNYVLNYPARETVALVPADLS